MQVWPILHCFQQTPVIKSLQLPIVAWLNKATKTQRHNPTAIWRAAVQFPDMTRMQKWFVCLSCVFHKVRHHKMKHNSHFKRFCWKEFPILMVSKHVAMARWIQREIERSANSDAFAHLPRCYLFTSEHQSDAPLPTEECSSCFQLTSLHAAHLQKLRKSSIFFSPWLFIWTVIYYVHIM